MSSEMSPEPLKKDLDLDARNTHFYWQTSRLSTWEISNPAVDWGQAMAMGTERAKKQKRAELARMKENQLDSIRFVSIRFDSTRFDSTGLENNLTSTCNIHPLLVRIKLGVKRKMRAAGNKSVGGGCPFSAMTSSSATERLPLERTTAPAKNVTKREGARRPPAPPGGPFGPAALKIVAGLALEGKSKTTL